MTFAPPELLPLYEPMKGFVCVSSAKHRGVIEHEGVVSISPGQNYGGEKTVAVMGDDVDPIAHYLLDEVWGAWLEWPVLYYTAHHFEQHRRGPEFFLELSWAPWEWKGSHGEDLHHHDNVEHKNSIWCDNTNTDIDPMIAIVRGPHDSGRLIGWARKNRATQKRVASFHYPDMP